MCHLRTLKALQTVSERMNKWPWLTLQIIAANIAVILALATAWYLAFMRQSDVYSDRLMSTFNIEPGQLHAMYVADVERQLWVSVAVGLCAAVLASIGLAFLIVGPLRSLARTTERLRHGDYHVRSQNEFGEIGRLAININALAAALEQEEDRRAQYLSDLGHELRTPITSLRGYTEGLQDGVFKADQKFFELLNGELSQLTALTHTIDAMQFSGAEAGRNLDEQRVGVDDFLMDARASWAARFQERGLQLELYIAKGLTERQLAIPVNSLKQIADNLLCNMLRYASVEAPCKISATKGQSADTVNITFRNVTSDVDATSLPFLFDRFFRVSKSRTRQQQEHPTGLGLSIVKQLCLSYEGNASATLDGQELHIQIDLPLGQRRKSFKRTSRKLEAAQQS